MSYLFLCVCCLAGYGFRRPKFKSRFTSSVTRGVCFNPGWRKQRETERKVRTDRSSGYPVIRDQCPTEEPFTMTVIAFVWVSEWTFLSNQCNRAAELQNWPQLLKITSELPATISWKKPVFLLLKVVKNTVKNDQNIRSWAKWIFIKTTTDLIQTADHLEQVSCV